MKIEEYAAKAMQAMMTVSLERCLEDPEAMADACFEMATAMADRAYTIEIDPVKAYEEAVDDFQSYQNTRGKTYGGELTDEYILECRTGDFGGVGPLPDGDGLVLDLQSSGLARWNVMIETKGRRRQVLIGYYPEVGITQARYIAKGFKSIKKDMDDLS